MNKVQDTEPMASLAPALPELMIELARLMQREDLPEARVEFWGPASRRSVYIAAADTTSVDTWCAAMNLGEPGATVHEYDDRSPLWKYWRMGTWLGTEIEVFVTYAVPTGDELVEQPAVQS